MLEVGCICLLIFPIYLICNKQSSITVNMLDRSHTEAIRGIAILLVVLGHSAGEFGTRVLNPFGSCGVVLFLIVSGYGVCKSYELKGLKHFWVKKFLHILLPYIIIQSLFCIFLRGGRNLSARTIISDILLINPLHPYGWYLRYLFVCYIIFYIIFKLKFSNKIKGVATTIICAIISLYMGYLEQIAMFAFSLGVLLAIYKKEDYEKKNLKFVMSISLLIGITLLGIKQLEIIRNGNKILFIGIEIIEIYALSLFVIIFIYLFYKFFRGAKTISAISYELYLVHAYTIVVLKEPNYINIAIFIVITASISFVFHKLNQWLEIKCRFLIGQ